MTGQLGNRPEFRVWQGQSTPGAGGALHAFRACQDQFLDDRCFERVDLPASSWTAGVLPLLRRFQKFAGLCSANNRPFVRGRGVFRAFASVAVDMFGPPMRALCACVTVYVGCFLGSQSCCSKACVGSVVASLCPEVAASNREFMRKNQLLSGMMSYAQPLIGVSGV